MTTLAREHDHHHFQCVLKVLDYSQQDFMIDPMKVAKAKESVEMSVDWRNDGSQQREHPLGSFSKCFSLENPQLCVLAQNHWLCTCSHTRGFSILPFIGFLPHKSLDFWHEQHFWQWGVKSCEIRVQLCNAVCLLVWQTNGWIPNKKRFCCKRRC